MRNLAKDIETCLEAILCNRVRSPTKMKMKSGAAVYRITGANDLVYQEDGHKVLAHGSNGLYTEVTRDNFEDLRTHNYMQWWEVVLLHRGRERTRKELEEALVKLGHAVTVRIGGGNNNWYPASIAVEQLSKPIAPGDKFDAKMLAGELVALGEALAPIQKTLDNVSLRMRALGIALTINLKD